MATRTDTKLRRTPPQFSRQPDYDDDYNKGVSQHVNTRTMRTDFDKDLPFYREGGRRDPELKCKFICSAMNPTEIELGLSPTGVSWDYNLRTQVYNTLGGQVVQILGIDITNLKIQGYFGFERFWGVEIGSRGRHVSGYDGERSYKWQTDPSFKNGLVQMSHWFRDYFNLVTQTGDYDRAQMRFTYPHRGWDWVIRPKEFPKVRFAHDEVAPQWEINADLVEYLQDHFIVRQINYKVKEDLNRLQAGVGKFTEFLKFSEPATKSRAAVSSSARALGTRYGDYVNSFGKDELEALVARGFSYPAYGDAEIQSLNK